MPVLSELSKIDPAKAYSQVKAYIDSSGGIDPMLHEELGWIIYRYVKTRISDLSSLEVRTLLKDYIFLRNERPSMLHSQMLSLALGFSKGHPDFSFYRFFMLWGPENLRQEDFDKAYYNDNEIPSLISRICRQIVHGGENIDVEALFEKINLPKPEILDLLREQEFWRIMNLHKEGKKHAMFDAFTAYTQKYAAYGASRWHSEVLRIAEHYMTDQDAWRFIYFFRDWGCGNLIDADWEDNSGSGKIYNILAVKAAKKCYECVKVMRPRDSGLVAWIESLYDTLVAHIAADEWILRQRAIIYTWQQRYDIAISIYKSLLLEMSEKYYIWGELADCVRDNNELKIALLSKALLSERNEDFLGAIRLALADLLIEEGLMPEALCELNTYRKSRDTVPRKYQELIGRIDKPITALSNNKSLYNKYVAVAEEYAFSEIEAIAVTLVDRREEEGKTRCVFTNGADVSFRISARRFPFLMKARLGSVCGVKCHKEEDGKRTRYVPLCMCQTGAKLWSGLPRKVGYVEYLNGEKKILHIVTQDAKRGYCLFKEKWGTISKGDFVSFGEYANEWKGEKRIVIVDVEKEEKKNAVAKFDSGIAVVDNVNVGKNLFHYTFGPGRMGGVVFFSDTFLRPEVGQCLKIFYSVVKDRKGEDKLTVIHLEETEETNPDVIKTVQGNLVLKFRHNSGSGAPDFAFVEDYYVHRSTLDKYHITANCHVSADVMYAGEGKWKVIRIRR